MARRTSRRLSITARHRHDRLSATIRLPSGMRCRRCTSARSPSLRDRVRGAVAGAAGRHGPTNPDLAAVGLDRDVTFVVPVRYGLRYRSRRQLLTLDVDLFDAERDGRDGILLHKVTTGPRGRGLVIAPEAKAKGYIQHVDIIELEAGQGKKTTVRSRMRLSPPSTRKRMATSRSFFPDAWFGLT